METQGPERPKVYAMRPTRKLKPWPVMAEEFESATPCNKHTHCPTQDDEHMNTANIKFTSRVEVCDHHELHMHPLAFSRQNGEKLRKHSHHWCRFVRC